MNLFMRSQFSVINAATVSGIIDTNRPLLYELVRDAYLSFGRKLAINPSSSFLSFSELHSGSLDRIIALPAYLGGHVDVAGIKWVASFPGNLDLGLPRASAVLVLNDANTGRPFACMEGSLISAARTAASAALGAELIYSGCREVPRVGFVGCGVIALAILRCFIDLHWQFGAVHLFDQSRGHSERFAQAAANFCKYPMAITDNLSDLLANTDLLILATTAGKPYIFDIEGIPQKVLNISLRDLSPEIILSSDNLVDDIDHCLRANTSVHLAEQKINSRNFALTNIYDCFDANGAVSWKPRGDRPVIFSPFGLGVLDVAVGSYIFQEAAKANKLVVIDSFFPSEPEAQGNRVS
jgi:ornithine cyclodeaminase